MNCGSKHHGATRFQAWCILIALSQIFLAGCGTEPSSAGRFAVVPPEIIEVDGLSWQRQEWNKKVDSKVASLFRRSPGLADNPSLNGDNVCYSSGSKQRIYWLTAMNGTSQWAMVEFAGSRGGELIEGSGEPFLELAPVVE